MHSDYIHLEELVQDHILILLLSYAPLCPLSQIPSRSFLPGLFYFALYVIYVLSFVLERPCDLTSVI